MSDEEYDGEVWVDLDEIDEALRPALDMRVGLDAEAVESYAESVGKWPPVLLIHDATGATHWVVDGRHRITAARQAGKDKVKARVKEGTYEDAYREASRANEVNGIRVTNADKRHRVERALQNGAWEDWSSNRIAKLCGVSQPFVDGLRSKRRSNRLNVDDVEPPTKRVDTIGREQPAKKPKPKAEKRLYRNDETPLLDRDVPDTCHDTCHDTPDTPDTPYEPPPPFVSPVLDMNEVDWDECWADIEGSIMEHYNAWPVSARSTFVKRLVMFTWQLHSFHPEVTLVTEREREEDSDAEETIPTDA